MRNISRKNVLFLVFLFSLMCLSSVTHAADIFIGNDGTREGEDGTVQLRFRVEVDRGLFEFGTVTVNFSTTDDTAVADSDYIPANGKLRFTSIGDEEKYIFVSVIGDALEEEDERFFVDLSNPENGSIARGRGVGWIINNDFNVNNTADDRDLQPGDGKCEVGINIPVCTLRAAIEETNALAGPNGITLPPGTYSLTRTGRNEDSAFRGDLDVTDTLTIVGAGADSTSIDANEIDRVFHVLPNANLTISGVTIREGFATGLDGAGINLGAVGGGIMHQGVSLRLFKSVLRNNRANGGGAIYSAYHPTNPPRTVLIEECSFTENRAEDLGFTNADGGAIKNGGGTIIIRSSSFFDNYAASGTGAGGGGSAIRGESGGDTVLIENSTISGNTGSPAVGSLNVDFVLDNVTIANNLSYGVGFGSCAGCGVITFSNTIVANNATQDCAFSLSKVISNGFNLSSDSSCGFTGTGDLENTDPLLGPLQDNGGFTLTHALLAGSPAIDAGDNTGCPADDQRGIFRPQDGDGDSVAVCDIGAYELFLSKAMPWVPLLLLGE